MTPDRPGWYRAFDGLEWFCVEVRMDDEATESRLRVYHGDGWWSELHQWQWDSRVWMPGERA